MSVVIGTPAERGDALAETIVGIVLTGIAALVVASGLRAQTHSALQPTYDVSASTVQAQDIVDELRVVAAYDKNAQRLLRQGGTMQFRGAQVTSDGTVITVVVHGVTQSFDPRSGN